MKEEYAGCLFLTQALVHVASVFPRGGGKDLRPDKFLTRWFVCLKLGAIRAKWHMSKCRRPNIELCRRVSCEPFDPFQQMEANLRVCFSCCLTASVFSFFTPVDHLFIQSSHFGYLRVDRPSYQHLAGTFHLSNPISWDRWMTSWKKGTMQLRYFDHFPVKNLSSIVRLCSFFGVVWSTCEFTLCE